MRFRSGRSPEAFTILELLIVLGIVLVLAGLAMENYQRALINTRIARVRSDLRLMAQAIESYTVDHARVPRMADFEIYGDETFDVVQGVEVRGIMSRALSTPIAYLSVAQMTDPFMAASPEAAIDERIYTYHDMAALRSHEPESAFWAAAEKHYGAWRCGAVGVDQTYYHGFANSAQLPYDPTNGLVSYGNLWHSQRGGVDNSCPVPELLAPH